MYPMHGREVTVNQNTTDHADFENNGWKQMNSTLTNYYWFISIATQATGDYMLRKVCWSQLYPPTWFCHSFSHHQRGTEKIQDIVMSIVICIDLWWCLFEKEVIFWISSNLSKVNFYLLWHRLKSVMGFPPSYVNRRKKYYLDKSPWLSLRCSVSFWLEKVAGCYGRELWPWG